MDLETADRLQQAGRYADAARCYQALLERAPDHAAALHNFGVMHQRCGYPARAVEFIGRAVALRPDVAAFHANLAESHRALGNAAQAADCCRTALRLQPNHAEAANNLGVALHDLGRYEEALEQFQAALAVRPNFAMAWNNLGTSRRALGRTDETMQAYREAVRLDPALALAHANLGELLTDQGQPAEALPLCQEAVRLRPDLAAAQNSLGNALRALEHWSEARAAYTEAVRLQPGLAVAHANLGITLRREGRLEDAAACFRRAYELAPQDALQQLANLHALDDDWALAIPYCERRAELKPDDADAHCELGWAYQADARPAEAEAAYRRALELQPVHLDAWLNIGLLHEEAGALADAEASYCHAETLHPRSPLPLTRRAMLLRGRLPDRDRDRLLAYLDAPLAPGPRMSLLFALAHVADARGDYAEAARRLEPANALARELRRSRGQFYDPDEHTRFVDRLIAAFTPALFERLAGAGDDTAQPVFVFGLPRSGTTLVEQVLASHSQVFGAGELPLAHRALNGLPVSTNPHDARPSLDALVPAEIRRLARDYRDGVQALLARQVGDSKMCPPIVGQVANLPCDDGDTSGRSATCPTLTRIVDKMPDNYLCLGLIALLFPRATLIHVRRDIRDVALSCWLTHFRSIRWADDPQDLARRCRDYQRLMDHWRAVLPRPVHEVCYERLVDDFEPEARRLLAACGLNWEPPCLQFHQTARRVRTASVTQVRQPLYRTALGRWKAYKPHLGFLFDQLVMV